MSEKVTLKIKLIILSLIVIGLLILIISITSFEGGFWKTFLNTISTALIVSGVWTSINQYFLRKDFISLHNSHTDRIIEKIDFSRVSREIGINRLFSTADKYDYKNLILNSEKLTIVLNDGRTWLNWNLESMQARFNDETKETVFIFLHPNSDFLEIMAHKVSSTRDVLKTKVVETIKMLNSIKTEKTNLAIFGHHFYNSHSVFLTEDIAVMTPYTISRARKVPIVFEFLENTDLNCYYNKIKDDIHVLLQDSEDISKIG